MILLDLVVFNRFKKVMMSGVDKGLWEQQTGIGPNGTFRLEIDEFDPTDGEYNKTQIPS